MTSDQSDPTKPHGLIVSPSIGLVKLSDGGSSALSEIIERSLLNIQTSRDLVMPARKAGEESEFEIAPGVKIVMCWIPPDEFLMGSPKDEENRSDKETQHRVKITQGFWLAKTQITQGQWQSVMGNNPIDSIYYPSYLKGVELPVVIVSRLDICGDESGDGGFLGSANKFAGSDGRFYLPTEAQWEYACRAGTTGPYYGNIDEIAWYKENSDGKPHPVAQKNPNAWGLHDMLGNVSEWCSDRYGAYDVRAATDPEDTASDSCRMFRGGSWNVNAVICRAAYRNGNPYPDYNDYDIGFRLARSSIPSAARGGANGTQRGASGVAE